MKVFIFEDMEERMHFFRKRLASHEIQHTDQIEQAKKMLEGHKWDRIFLDHDMVMKFTNSETTKNNGYQLAKWMVKNKIQADEVIVHSMNPEGSRNIMNTLEGHYDAKYVPFTFLTVMLRG